MKKSKTHQIKSIMEENNIPFTKKIYRVMKKKYNTFSHIQKGKI